MPLESKNNFGDFFDIYPQPVAVSDMKMARFINVNDKFCKLTQYTREEILGATIDELGFYTEPDRKRFIHELNISGEINGFEKDFKPLVAFNGAIITKITADHNGVDGADLGPNRRDTVDQA